MRDDLYHSSVVCWLSFSNEDAEGKSEVGSEAGALAGFLLAFLVPVAFFGAPALDADFLAAGIATTDAGMLRELRRVAGMEEGTDQGDVLGQSEWLRVSKEFTPSKTYDNFLELINHSSDMQCLNSSASTVRFRRFNMALSGLGTA